MLETVREDLYSKAEWYGLPRTPRSLLRMCVSDGSSAQILYRAMRWCEIAGLKPLSLFLYRLNAHLSHCIIGRGADFGPGFVLVHSIGVVINTSVRAGRNLIVEHGVTIGAEKSGSPVLGDNVFVGAGAKVLGSVRVGSNVKIGANAVVTRDIPDGATAVGIPARVVRIYGERVPGAHAGADEDGAQRDAACPARCR